MMCHVMWCNGVQCATACDALSCANSCHVRVMCHVQSSVCVTTMAVGGPTFAHLYNNQGRGPLWHTDIHNNRRWAHLGTHLPPENGPTRGLPIPWESSTGRRVEAVGRYPAHLLPLSPPVSSSPSSSSLILSSLLSPPLSAFLRANWPETRKGKTNCPNQTNKAGPISQRTKQKKKLRGKRPKKQNQETFSGPIARTTKSNTQKQKAWPIARRTNKKLSPGQLPKELQARPLPNARKGLANCPTKRKAFSEPIARRKKGGLKQGRANFPTTKTGGRIAQGNGARNPEPGQVAPPLARLGWLWCANTRPNPPGIWLHQPPTIQPSWGVKLGN